MSDRIQHTTVPDIPDSAPRRHGNFGRLLGKTVLALLRWKVVGPFPITPKLVIIGGPHTSNWDAVIGIAAMLSLDLDIRIMAKHTVFRGPVGWIMKWLHAIPVDRTKSQGVTEQMVEAFNSSEKLFLGIAPEGTRTNSRMWRTGFYRIARDADVPILPVALDFGVKQIRLAPAVHLTGNMEADIEKLKEFVYSAKPKRIVAQ